MVQLVIDLIKVLIGKEQEEEEEPVQKEAENKNKVDDNMFLEEVTEYDFEDRPGTASTSLSSVSTHQTSLAE